MPDRVDDPNIGDNELLLRRVSPSQINHALGSTKPPPQPSLAFTSNAVLISVDRKSLTTLDRVVENYPEHSVLEVPALAVREAECIIVSDPLPDNPAHALILGNGPDNHLKKKEAKAIARKSNWVLYKKP